MVKLSEVFSAMTAGEYMICSKQVAFQGEPEDVNYVVVYDKDANEEHGMHVMKRVYRILPNDELEELPVEKMIREVKEAVKDRVSVDELLDQVLHTGGPHSLVKAHSIIKKHPEVKERIQTRRGCLYLDIPNPEPGEQGASLYLRM